jgi:DNA-binding NtrC family response regulator
VAISQKAELGAGMWRKWRVLGVSQHIGTRTLLTIRFKRGGHDVEVVSARAEAMDIIAKQIPDLVILDLYLSDEPGLKLAADLRALYHQLPILLIPPYDQTRTVSQDDLRTAKELCVTILYGGVGVLSHNFTSEVHKLLDRS